MARLGGGCGWRRWGRRWLALWLFLPIAAAIGSLFFDRIAEAVERRWYPTLPPARPAAMTAQIWDGIALGGRILVFNLLALVLALIIPGVGLILGWAIAAYAMGRGLFVGVAMRRMPRMAAEALYMRNRPLVLVQGAALAFAGSIAVPEPADPCGGRGRDGPCAGPGAAAGGAGAVARLIRSNADQCG